MKNSKEYSKKVLSLYQTLKRKYKSRRAALKLSAGSHQVLDSLVYGIIGEKLDEKDTESAMKRFSEYFVDWNDLRVSRIEEIAELLGSSEIVQSSEYRVLSTKNSELSTNKNDTYREIALTINKVLNRIYNENHHVSLESLIKLGKRPARQKLVQLFEAALRGEAREKIEELSSFAIDYCMLTALGGHAIPLTENMIEYLKNDDLVDARADAQVIAGFLAKQISAKNGYEFYKLLRHESETSARRTSAAGRAVKSPEGTKKEHKTKNKVKAETAHKKTKRKK